MDNYMCNSYSIIPKINPRNPHHPRNPGSSFFMLTLLLLFHLSSPSFVEQTTSQVLTADSLSANETLLVPFREEIERASCEYMLPASLIAAVIQEESRFDAWATRSEPRYMRSRKVRRSAARFARAHRLGPTAFTELTDRSRSYGLMQVMGETAREQGFDPPFLAELYIPQNAIAHGAMLLNRLLKRYHNDTLSAISAYNQGSARKRRGVFANARYVYRVTIAWRSYSALFRNGGAQ
jgi:soluble lytic murein transglycosylase-like protein